MKDIAQRLSAFAAALLLGVSVAWAQAGPSPQGQAQQPGSGGQQASGSQASGQNAGSSETSVPSGEEQNGEPGQAPALTGAEAYTLSRMGAGRSYLVPSFQFAQSVNTSGTGGFGTARVDPISTLSGVFALHHLWGHYELEATYAGSGFLYERQSQFNTSAHEFTLRQTFGGRRSTFRLSDVVSYLPESSFGYARFSGFNNFGPAGYGYGGLFGTTGGNLYTNFLPNQSILTGPSSRVSNAVVGEYDYRTSPLGSLTITGAYTMLRFPSSSFIDNDDAIFQVGYNRTLTRKNSLGVSYQAGWFGFGSSTGNFTNHVVQLTYRRTVSERLGLQFGAGPQINQFESGGPGQDTGVSWQASGLLNYKFRRSSVGLYYQHFTSGGAGVYRGARTDYVSLSYGLPLSRMWSVDSSLGYARNSSLQSGNPGGPGRSYNAWFGTVNVHRAVNRWLSLFFSYNLQQQLASAPSCVGSTCGTFYTQQYFSFGVNWHPALVGVE